MKGVKITLVILAILLFVSNYKICDYFYYVNGELDAKGWWGLKSNIYAVIVALVFLSSSIGSRGILRFFLDVGVGFAIANVIDKVYFNVIEFTTEDIYMIIIVISISAFDAYKNSKYKK